MRKIKFRISFLLLMLTAGCAGMHERAFHSEMRETDCPLGISPIGESFNDAGGVKVRFTPQDLDEIFVLPSNGFEAIGSAEEEHPGLDSSQEYIQLRKIAKLKSYRLSWGLSGATWNSVSQDLGRSKFVVPPGRYYIVARYSISEFASVLCVARSSLFEVKEPSLWLSTDDWLLLH